MGQKVASLEIELAMATGGAIADLNRFGGVMDKTTAHTLQAINKIDDAMKGAIDLDPATQQMVKLAEQSAKTAVESAREFNRIERAGERMAAQLERQLSVFGKTTGEVRSLKAETAALAAEQAGQAELAARIRAAEAALYDQEFAATRRARQEQEAAAEDRAIAADQAEKAASREATALREAAHAHQMFEARARAGAIALRDAETAAAADAIAVARLREMLDPAAAAQDRLTNEIAEARRVMIAAGFSAEELARAEGLLTQRHGGLIASNGQMKAGMQQLSFQANDMATMWAMQAKPMQIFASQAGQVIQALQLMSGNSKGLLGFLGGPWGMGITTAAVVLAPFVAKLFESSEASKEAEKAFDSFVKHQADIANFIDLATGKLTEQNAELVRNAILTRQAQIDKNIADTADQRRTGLNLARTASQGGYLSRLGNAAQGYLTRGGDPYANLGPDAWFGDADVRSAMLDAAGDVGKLSSSIYKLSQTTRPDLRGLALDISNQAGQAILAARENERLRKEMSALGGDTTALSGANLKLIETQVAIAAATTPLEKAQANLSAVRQRAGAIEKMTGDAQKVAAAGYRTDLLAATQAVKAAEQAEKDARVAKVAHNKEVRDANKEAREAAALQRELASTYDGLLAKLDPAGGAQKAYIDTLNDIGRLEAANLLSRQDSVAWQLRANQQLAKSLEEVRKASEVSIGTPDLDGILERGLKPLNDALEAPGKMLDDLAQRADDAASAMERAFGRVGGAIGDATALLADYGKRQAEIDAQREAAGTNQEKLDGLAKDSANLRLSTMIGLTGAAKNLFNEHSKGYKAMEAAEKALTILQLARTAVDVAGGAAKMFAHLGPWAFPAVAAMLGVMASLGFSGGANVSMEDYTKGNTGAGTVLGDSDAKSESLLRSIDMLRDVEDATLNVSRSMLNSLRSIESRISGLSSLLVRTGSIDGASAGVETGFNSSLSGGLVGSALFGSLGLINNTIGKLPIVGGIINGVTGVIKSLFGTKTTVVGGGIYGNGQTIGDILSNGFDAQTYSDIQKKKKFLGITSGTSYSTVFGGAVDDDITNQFALILRGFNDTIIAAAGPLGASTSAISDTLSHFVVDIGKIDLQGLSGTEIQEKLEAVFGAAADGMAAAAFPGLERFQKVGEGAFETLVRVASTVEQVDATFQRLGVTTTSLGVDIDMAVAGLFDTVGDFTGAADDYFRTFYSEAEQTAAKALQMGRAFNSLGLTMPDTLAGFRQLVEAQDLATAAGQQTYATLLQLAPAFADLKGAMEGAASAAAIVRQREDLQSKLLQLEGDTTAIRAAELARLDPSNRALQEQIYAIQDAQEAAKAAEELRKAWSSVGDSIMDEVRRIRGLTDATGAGSYATLLGQFNAASLAARAGDQDAAKTLPQLSRSMLDAAKLAATSRQELDRVQAQTAASLEATYAEIRAMGDTTASSATTESTLDALAASQATSTTSTESDLLSEMRAMREELAQLRSDTNTGNATIASNTGAMRRTLENVSPTGDAIMVRAA
ncbi:hypothetical protein PQ455_07445 [Sphingomonas naphthae]|uniref:Bacteriophage tail tape measure N-terminal domain-containing protein n=1 Tax=Sphingomonas naphthae TaxID=1813468 RepID=A0ABY7TRL9_9SPHN|nr:hypothetical protein [Sphingomonas naphthae]WCT75040.1 hypothetical protein PQ455_07445 [Sphingomonas naphthae]